jgi:putative transposase
VKELAPTHGGVTTMCRLLGLSESSYYYAGTGYTDADDDLDVLSALVKQAGKRPTDGYRRLTKALRKKKRFSQLNAKRVRRLMKQAGIQPKRRRKTIFTTDSNHAFKRYPNLVRDLTIERPDHVWVCDITYIVLSTGEIVYLAIVMDVFTRTIRGWALGTDLTHHLTVEALRRALRRGVCEIHHTDQGVQYATPQYSHYLTQRKIQISMAAVGKAWENGYAERWMRTLKEEEVYLAEYETYADALKNIGHFIDKVYNKKRIHSSLGDLSPAEFEAQWKATQ